MMKRLLSFLLACTLLLSACAVALADDVMRPGDKGDDVKALQQLLANYGYYTGKIDGVYGSGTTAAVTKFQRYNDLKKDGKAGPNTMAKLTGANVVPAPVNGSAAATAEVKHIQTRLTHYGFYKGAIDGVYGDETIAAVKAFQDANALKKDGAVGEKTLAKLNSETAVSKAAVDAEKATWLKKGDTGAAVSTLQQHLKDTLYYSGAVDGVFGDKVHDAVVQFQQSANIQADGIVGASTRNALYNRTSAIFNGGTPVRALYQSRQGYDVKVLQQRLSALNYFNAPVTGVFNDATAAAVKAFQKDHGMDQDGKVDAIVRRHLWPTTSENTPDKYPKLEKGDSGEYVTQAQMRLKAAGFLKDTADGVFGETTLTAVKAFQKSRKLTVDGKIGKNTWKALMGVSLSGANPSPTKPSSLVLRPGARGENVIQLQEYLVALGYSIKVDGIYGTKTTNAVKALQAAYGLTVDGKAGPNTLSKINQLLSK